MQNLNGYIKMYVSGKVEVNTVLGKTMKCYL